MLVTEWHGHCVTMFSAATGELLSRIGHDTGHFCNLEEVEISRDNYIFVKDKDSLQKFTLNGSHVTTIELCYMGIDLESLPKLLTYFPSGVKVCIP